MNLFIRGRPWTIIVDDIFLFDKNDEKDKGSIYPLKAAKIGDDMSLWGPILEKAWAKIMGNYDNADEGYIKNGISVLTGAPVFG